MMKIEKVDKSSFVGTNADSSTTVEDSHVSQPIAKPTVVRSPLLSNYLHLYLGCDVQWTQYAGTFKTGVYGTSLFNSQLLREVALGNGKTKLILRRLETISEEEDKECSNIMFGEYAEKVKGKNIIHYEGEKIRYLLSRGFDLFGLIENGLAIDAHAVQSNELHKAGLDY